LGGEVTLHPQLLKLIGIAKEKGFKKIHIISNGRKFKDKEFLKKLIKAGVNRFSVSIHSHKKEVEDYLTQVPGGFQEKISGLKNLVDLHNQNFFTNNISINFVINKKNYKDILRSLQYFKSLGLRDFRLNFMWPEGNALDYYKSLLISYSKFYPYIEKIITLGLRLNFSVVFEGIPYCVFYKPGDNKNYIGELRDVSTDVIAYEKNNKYVFNWQQRKTSDLKGQAEFCQQCIFNNICEGVWLKYIDFYGWDEFKPIK
jgi:MoaA/NifB/PqqE/SkfB family radical SAM enzyme